MTVFIDPTAALYTHILTLTDAVEALGSYVDGDTDHGPAVFEEAAPHGFKTTEPMAIIDPPHNMPRDETSTCTGRAIDMRVRVFAQVSGEDGATGYEALNRAAETLGRALHNSTPAIDGARTSRIEVNGPFRAPTSSPSIGGRILALKWHITET